MHQKVEDLRHTKSIEEKSGPAALNQVYRRRPAQIRDQWQETMRHISEEGFQDFFRHHPMAKVLDVGLASSHQAAGRAPNVFQVPWLTMDWKVNSDFLAQVSRYISPRDHVVVICSRGELSAEAGTLLERSGYSHVYNVLGGHRNHLGTQPCVS